MPLGLSRLRTTALVAALLSVASLVSVSACRMREESAPAPSEPEPTKAAVPKPAALAHAPAHPSAGRPRFIKAPGGAEDVPAVVRRELDAARAEKREVLVYVGATWCEPCARFHTAVEEGKLDSAFPRLTLVEFDTDRDGDRLRAAGYRSRYIPLFALPADDGRAAGKQIEGSVSGDGAVAEITPRLRDLLASAAVR